MENIKHFISPSFTHEKLEAPCHEDIVDVFEDRMVNWLLMPARKLLDVPHGGIAAVALATNYIEGIEIYISGQDSDRHSKEFFRRGYKRIFAPVSGPVYMQDAIANALYDTLRCGFAHDAMFRYRINFSNIRKDAFTITWTKKDGNFDPNGQLLSAIINPHRFIECIELHFKEYVKELRATEPTQTKNNFQAAVGIKWQLGNPSPIIGMTEHEFLSGAIPRS